MTKEDKINIDNFRRELELRKLLEEQKQAECPYPYPYYLSTMLPPGWSYGYSNGEKYYINHNNV